MVKELHHWWKQANKTMTICGMEAIIDSAVNESSSLEDNFNFHRIVRGGCLFAFFLHMQHPKRDNNLVDFTHL